MIRHIVLFNVKEGEDKEGEGKEGFVQRWDRECQHEKKSKK